MPISYSSLRKTACKFAGLRKAMGLDDCSASTYD